MINSAQNINVDDRVGTSEHSGFMQAIGRLEADITAALDTGEPLTHENLKEYAREVRETYRQDKAALKEETKKAVRSQFIVSVQDAKTGIFDESYYHARRNAMNAYDQAIGTLVGYAIAIDMDDEATEPLHRENLDNDFEAAYKEKVSQENETGGKLSPRAEKDFFFKIGLLQGQMDASYTLKPEVVQMEADILAFPTRER